MFCSPSSSTLKGTPGKFAPLTLLLLSLLLVLHMPFFVQQHSANHASIAVHVLAVCHVVLYHGYRTAMLMLILQTQETDCHAVCSAAASWLGTGTHPSKKKTRNCRHACMAMQTWMSSPCYISAQVHAACHAPGSGITLCQHSAHALHLQCCPAS